MLSGHGSPITCRMLGLAFSWLEIWTHELQPFFSPSLPLPSSSSARSIDLLICRLWSDEWRVRERPGKVEFALQDQSLVYSLVSFFLWLGGKNSWVWQAQAVAFCQLARALAPEARVRLTEHCSPAAGRRWGVRWNRNPLIFLPPERCPKQIFQYLPI